MKKIDRPNPNYVPQPSVRIDPLKKYISEIHGRGNDVELRECKDGLKVIEVHRKVIAII
jgi:hypothetical protein